MARSAAIRSKSAQEQEAGRLAMGETLDIGAWLRGLGLERYETAFRGNDVDAGLLPRLTADDLREIGVASVGHRRRLLEAIAALRPAAGEAAVARADDGRPEQPRTPGEPQAEQRQVTVLFADLVGSTALARGLDPEELRELLRAYEELVVGEVGRLEGHAAKFMGDGVLALFGWPRAHEDDAERAVRAGLAIIGTVGRLAAPGGAPLQARVGIATGPVVVGELLGRGAAREDVIGQTPNLAARLQALTEPGGVVIAPSTHRLAGGLFECADLGRHDLKGFAEPVRAWRVLGPGGAAGRFEAREAAAGLTPLVGREAELALLLDRWELARAGEGQAVLLSGEPGIGKSRLVRALRERLAGEPHAALRYQCSPHHMNTSLQPVVEQLGRAAGFRRSDTAEGRLAKLEALVAGSVADVGAVVPLLADLLAIPAEGRYPPLDLAPRRRRELTLRTLVDQMVGLAARRPVLIVLEDAHWADPTTLELFGLAIDRARDLPALVSITFRPEFAPPWTDRAHATALTLSRLGRRQAAGMVGRVAGTRTLPAEVVEPIVAKADGVPLFVEELTKAVLEGGLLGDEGDRYVLARPLPQFAIPDTLQASLLARLDRLAPARRVAQVAAVIGRELGHGLLAAVAEMPRDRLAAALEDLVASGLLLRQGLPPEATYAFKHALVRDAAYETLLRGERRRLHGRIVQALQEHVPEQVGAVQPELLAHHCAEAGLLDQAIAHRREAGRRAAARSAVAEAVAHYTKALDLLAGLPAGPGRDRTEFDLQVALGAAYVASRGPAVPEVGKAYERARQLCAGEAESSPLLAALSGLFTFRLHASSVDAAIGTAEEMLRIAEHRRDGAALAAGHRCLGTGLLFRGRLAQALAQFERALALYEGVDHASPVFLWSSDLRVACLNFVPLVLHLQGHPDRALARSRDGLAAASELGHPFSLSHALHLSCWLHQIRGEPWVVRERTGVMMPLTAEHGFSNWSATAEMFHGWALAAGEEREAVAEGIVRMRGFLAREHDRGKLLLVPHVLGLLAGALT
jgi:class 3 adenylate cyclase/tetratricopeptide (TPR) repeat protein